MIASTVERVPASTGQESNRRIAAETAKSVRWHASHREFIDQRLDELGREWDIERTLEANASTLAFAASFSARPWTDAGSLCLRLSRPFFFSTPCRAGARPCRSCGASASGRRGRSRRSAMR